MSSIATVRERNSARKLGIARRVAHTVGSSVRTHRLTWLAALYIALNTGDLASTALGLSHGMLEGNPLMNALLAQHGFGALIVYKAAITLFVLVGMRVLRLWNARGALGALLVCDVLLCVVVCSNMAQYLALAR